MDVRENEVGPLGTHERLAIHDAVRRSGGLEAGLAGKSCRDRRDTVGDNDDRLLHLASR
jgi:hypothetical protein